jgi:sensor histidine kinase YesM
MMFMKLKRAVLSFLFVVFYSAIGLSQKYINYTIDHGLISNSVYYIMQDSKGFIWFCTDSGVSRFDGSNWDNFTLDDGLADNDIFKCYEDSKHRIWFLSANGKFSYYFQNKIHKIEFLNPSKNDEIGMLYDCLEDKKNGRIYFLSSARKLYFFENKNQKIIQKKTKLKNFFLSHYKNEIYSFSNHDIKHQIFAFCISNNKIKPEKFKFKIDSINKSGYYYIKNANPVVLQKNHLIYQTTSGIVQAFNGSIIPYLAFDNFSKKGGKSIFLTRIHNEIFFGGANGVFKLITSSSSKQLQTKLFFGNVIANHIVLDKAGNYWIATNNKGVLFLPRNYSTAKTINIADNQTETFSICKLINNQILIGLPNSSYTVYQSNKSKTTTKKFFLSTKKEISRIKNIFEIGNQTFFLGDNLFLVEDSKSKKELFRKDNFYNTLKSYCLNKQKTKIWLVSSQYIQQFDIRNKTICDSINFSKQCSSIALNSKDELYVGTTQGLYKQFASKKFISLNYLSSLFEAGVSSLVAEKEKLWVATHGYGIVLLEKDKVKKIFNRKSGLVNNTCNRLVSDKNNLFVCTNSGLSIIDKKTFKINNLTKNDGIISNEIRDVLTDEQNDIHVATDKGISILTWTQIQKSVSSPTPYLRVFQVNDSIFLNNQQPFEVLYSPGLLSLQFSSITFNLPHFVYYRYRIKGEKNWQTNSSGNISFYNLSPGNYSIELQAKQYKSTWSKPIFTSFNILPLWYQTTTFKIMAISLMLLSLTAAIYWRIRWIRNRDKVKHLIEIRMNELERRTLAAQMNPHFIFNSLNTLQQLVLDEETETALNYLNDFAVLVRQILSNSRKPAITITEEITFLKNYLLVEKVRYNDAFNFEIEVQTGLDEMIAIPPMLIQPIVENAIKYGVSTATLDFPKIYIKIWQETHFLNFQITDNGAGFEKVKSLQQKNELTKSNALEILTERLALIFVHNKRGSMTLTSFDESDKQGTQVHIQIPI